MRSNPSLAYHPTCSGAALEAVKQHSDLVRVWQIADGHPSNLFVSMKAIQPKICRVSPRLFTLDVNSLETGLCEMDLSSLSLARADLGHFGLNVWSLWLKFPDVC